MSDINKTITLLRGLDRRTDARIDTGHLPTDHRILSAILKHGADPVVRDYVRGVLGDVPTVEHLIWKAWDLDRHSILMPRLTMCGIECEAWHNKGGMWAFRGVNADLYPPKETSRQVSYHGTVMEGMWLACLWPATPLDVQPSISDSFLLWDHLAKWARDDNARVAQVGR